MKRISVFLASSNTLNDERLKIQHWIGTQSDSWSKRGIYLNLVMWENLSRSFSETRKQEQFNKHVIACEIFICLIYDRIGEFTREEFEKARQSLKAGNFPRLLLVYFKTTPPPDTAAPGFQKVIDLQNKIETLEQMWGEYSNIDNLLLQLTREFDTYLSGLKSFDLQHTYSNLPNMLQFFGRKKELTDIADALDLESRGWGVLIDGPGGIGKTSLAIVAAGQAPMDTFPIKIFLSAKTTVLTEGGRLPISDYAMANFDELISELAKELEVEDIGRTPVSERPKVMRRCLSKKNVLLVLDNIEDFATAEAGHLYEFLNRLPPSCKAIVTSRRRGGYIHARPIRLDRLQLDEALELMDELAEQNPALARALRKERENLFSRTGGNPLLIKWVCGQLSCEGSKIRTIQDACDLLKSAPPDNDPLEFIFGNLLDTFDPEEIAVLSALTYFSEPAELEWVAVLAHLHGDVALAALERLTDRALLNADDTQKRFFLPTLTATFLRRARPEVVEQSGNRLLNNVYAQVDENGSKKYQRFPKLESQWLSISTALRFFKKSDNIRFQWFCEGISTFLDFSGRHDELLSLYQLAEQKADNEKAFNIAATRAYQVGCIFRERQEADKVLAAASRCERYWQMHIDQVNLGKSEDALIRMGKQEEAMMSRLRGLFQQLTGHYAGARDELLKAQRLHESVEQNRERILVMNDLALLFALIRERFASERYLRNALKLAKDENLPEEVLLCLKNLSRLQSEAGEQGEAQMLVREGLRLAKEINCTRLIEEFSNQLSASG